MIIPNAIVQYNCIKIRHKTGLFSIKGITMLGRNVCTIRRSMRRL